MVRQVKNAARGKSPAAVDEGKMAVSVKGLRLLVVGLIVIVSGFILLAGGKSENPDLFNWEMFNFTRMVVAPVLIIAGIVIEVVGIMGRPKDRRNA